MRISDWSSDVCSSDLRVGGRLLSGIARYLGLASDFFDDTVADGNSVMRLLHYPPVAAPAKGIRAEAHEDINTITLLLGAEEAGLEILDKDGSWLPVSPPPGAMAVNVGDRSEEHTSEITTLMRISYAVF